MTKIVAFAGRKQSGKTTCAEAAISLCRTYGLHPKIYNFADPLKQDICINILGMTHEQCYGNDIDKNTLTNIVWDGSQLTAREVMQFVGTDVFRKLKNDVWAGATIKKIQIEKPDIALIADCRFPNEVEAVRAAGGLVIKLMRNPYNSDHTSEIALDTQNYNPENFDIVIDNTILSITEQTEIVTSFLKQRVLIK